MKTKQIQRPRGRRARGGLTLPRVLSVAAAIAQASLGCRSEAQAPASRPVDQVLLGDLYAQAQRTNPRAAAARAFVQAAQARVSGASRPPDPQVQLGFMNYSIPGFAPMPAIGMTQLQLMQMIPLAGKLSLSGVVAGAHASTAAARAEDIAWDVRNQAAMAFYDLYATDQGLGVARQTLRVLQDIERTAEAMYRVGEGRQADVLRAQVEVAKMGEDTLRMQAMRASMVAKINALLDRDPGSLVGTPALPRFPDGIPARAQLDSIAFGGRSMIRAGVEDVRAADASERLARKEIIPDLAIGVQVGQRGGAMGTERMGSLMIGASVPVFARDRQYRMGDEAAAMSLMARSELAAIRAETRGRIGESYAALARARTLAQLYRTTVLPQAEATVASALSAYRVGSVDFMTLFDDRMAVNRYRQELYRLEADQGKAWAELEMLTGRELMDPNTSRSEAGAGSAPRGGAR